MSTYRFDGQYPITKKKKKGKRKERKKKKTRKPPTHTLSYFSPLEDTLNMLIVALTKKNQKTLSPQSFQEQIIGKQD